ncbi:DoxX family membrane protein [Yeosuana sp. MJ-SS3]|uniref:DoxX family membrane protein n=1 Tax=Gilvirhabdus luticola TaxID=3079858 RepID=A0ABU3UA41_9FLAO|nr:DoxX family membrane protein [Yeosuana sp. MJ-SS3]MDU8887282.1 DoxX family membrane protein [Yeosuana sp. MJ-SS3]
MKTYTKNLHWVRYILGLFLIVYALNKFFHFIPSTYGQMTERAQDFLDSTAFLLPYLYIFEILLGVFLLLNKWVAFLYIVLFPLTISFLIFTFFNYDLGDMWPALIVAVLNIILLFSEREKYKPLFN